MASIISISQYPPDIELRDAQSWISNISWSSIAPADIRDAAKSECPQTLASRLQADIRRRTQRQSTGNSRGAARHSGLAKAVALCQFVEGPETARRQQLLELAGAKKANAVEKQLTQWLKSVNKRSPITVPELLILLELLNHVGPRWSAEVFLETWIRCLSATAQIVQRIHNDESSQLDAAGRLLVEGELPWRLGIFFRMISGSKTLLQHGRGELRRQLLEFTDTDGTPCAALLGQLPHWLGCLIRSAQTATQAQETLWNSESADRFRYAIGVMATLTNADGTLALSEPQRHSIHLLSLGIQLADFEKKTPPARLVRRLKRHQQDAARGYKRIRSSQLPSVQSDWGRLAILRSHWAIDADQVTVTHHEPAPHIHLDCMGQTIINGTWKLQLQIQGRTVRDHQDWSCVCWQSDSDMDYLELQATPSDEVRIDRQILLSRKQHFLILADSVAAPSGSRVKYTSRLPLVAGVHCTSDNNSREYHLQSADRNIRAFPLALPQDSLYSVDGGLKAESGYLELSQVGQSGLYAPLVLNWHPDQSKARAFWRSLTVTQNRKILTPAESAAFRLQLGKQQWLIYRRIREFQQLQTVLGLHTGNETVIADVGGRGRIKPILLVDA